MYTVFFFSYVDFISVIVSNTRPPFFASACLGRQSQEIGRGEDVVRILGILRVFRAAQKQGSTVQSRHSFQFTFHTLLCGVDCYDFVLR